jgi:BirA family biotin operon repressor/biotin-[acetyl-CoA-carboxylase] ligase
MYASVERALAGTPFARILYFERTGSTNEDATALLGDDTSAGTTLVAEEQTRGAGRKGRSWIAPPHSGLLFTTILPREIAAGDLWIIPFWTALAVRDALLAFGIAAELQWPNDILLDGKKLAGILCVSRVTGVRARAACGVGINMYRSAAAQEDVVPPPAFCDDVATIARPELLGQILSRFAMRLPMLGVPEQVARRWERDAGIPGKRYRLELDGASAPFEATAIAIENGGRLLVEREGRCEAIALADARVLR